jgi:hypothetical protein
MYAYHIIDGSREVFNVQGMYIWNWCGICEVWAGLNCWVCGQVRNGAAVVELVIGHIVVVCERLLMHGACIVEFLVVGPVGW